MKESDPHGMQPGPTADDTLDLDDVNDNKIKAIQDLEDMYHEGGFRNEDEFLQQIKIDVGIDFDTYDAVKEFLFDNKLKSEKDDHTIIKKTFY